MTATAYTAAIPKSAPLTNIKHDVIIVLIIASLFDSLF